MKHEQLRGEKGQDGKREREKGKERRKRERVMAMRYRMTGENEGFFLLFTHY